MAFDRKSYSGPMKDRGEVMRGGKKLANVSKEELDDFRAKFGKDKTLRDLLNADRGSAPKAEAPKTAAPKAEAPKAEAPKAEAPVKRGAPRMGERKEPEPAKEITPRGRMKAGNRARAKEEPTVTAAPGATAVERMRNKMKERYGKKSGGSVSRRGDGIARKGKTKGKFV